MPLTSQDQQAIIDTHNTYRSDSAVKAQNIQWDSTLATGAQAPGGIAFQQLSSASSILTLMRILRPFIAGMN